MVPESLDLRPGKCHVSRAGPSVASPYDKNSTDPTPSSLRGTNSTTTVMHVSYSGTKTRGQTGGFVDGGMGND